MLPQALLLSTCGNSVVGTDHVMTICHTIQSETAVHNSRHLCFFSHNAFFALNLQPDTFESVEHSGKIGSKTSSSKFLQEATGPCLYPNSTAISKQVAVM